MKALVLYGPGSYRTEKEWREPEMRPGWARVRVTYAGICGSDLPRFTTTGSYHHPMVLGHEFTGTVDTPAPGSEKFKGGEKVAALPIISCGNCRGCSEYGPFHCEEYQFIGSRNDGGFAQYCMVPEENLVRLPEKTDPRFGAFLEPIAVALHVVRRSGFSAGQSALVFGAGAIGLLIGQWLKIFNAKQVVIADVRDESLQLARQAGFEDVINPAKGDLGALSPFDTAFEAAGSNSAIEAAIEKTVNKGTITVVGRDTGDTVIPLKKFEQFMRKQLKLIGCWGYDMRGETDFVRNMFEENRFSLAPLITQEVSLEQAPEIIDKMAQRSIYYCKVLIKI